MQIRKYLEVNKLTYDHQSGFLPQHSTVTQLCYLTHEWTMALDQRQCAQAAFLDLSKAYNRVPTAGLLFKLSGCGFSLQSLKWTNSFLANRRQKVFFFFFFCQYIFYKDGQIANRSKCEGVSLGQWE